MFELHNMENNSLISRLIPAGIYLFKVNSENTRAMCDFIINFGQISHIVLVAHCWL